jgi:hypothetical protein
VPVQLFAALTLPGQDPDLASWFVTLLEAVAAVAAGFALAGQSPRRWRDSSFWLVVSVVMLVFAVNKQSDVQTSLPDPRTAFSVLLALSVGTLSYLLWGSSWFSRYRLTVLGVGTLIAFALMRAADIGGAPFVAGRFGHAVSLPVEACGAALVVVGSMRQVGFPTRSRESSTRRPRGRV